MAFSTIHPETLIRALKMLKSGGFTVKAKDTDIVKVTTIADEITVDLQNLEIVKDLLGPFRELGILNIGEGRKEEKGSVLERLKMIKDVAEKLREEQTTITIKKQGESVLKVGERANPGLSKLLLGRSIEADLVRLLSLVRALR